jgi:hypothetical protein
MTSRRFARWPVPSADLRTLVLRVPPARIGLVCSIVEAYEGLAVVRTTDQAAGVIDVWVMPGRLPEVESILAELEKQFPMIRVRELSGHPNLEGPPAAGD